MKHIETDSLSNQNISSALAIGAYTANGDKSIIVDVSLDQVAGNGDYVMYVTRQIGGAGSAFVVLPKTTMTAASGETAIGGQSGVIAVRSGDVLTVYVKGLAGDTTTPDTTVRWFESDTPNDMALEATLTAIKGAGWSTETLVELDSAIKAVKAWAAAAINAGYTAGAVSQIRGNSWDIDITDMTLNTTKQQLMIKHNIQDPDSAALLFVDSVAGLLILNGVSTGLTASDAVLTYTGTTLNLNAKASITAQLQVGGHHYGVQGIDAAGLVAETYGGTWTILADIVQAVA